MVVGVGLDMVHVDRLRRVIQRTPGFVERVFTAAEWAYAQAAPRHTYQRLAARFAAKEALLKALGTGLRRAKWVEAEVCHDQLGRPLLALSGSLAELAAGKGVVELHLSMAHDRGYAIAHVLAVGAESTAGPVGNAVTQAGAVEGAVGPDPGLAFTPVSDRAPTQAFAQALVRGTVPGSVRASVQAHVQAPGLGKGDGDGGC